MDLELEAQYQEFLHLMGHRVIRATDGLWIDIRPFVLQPAPVFRLGPPPTSDIKKTASRNRALCCRWFSYSSEPPTAREQVNLYIVKPPYDFAQLHQKARNQTRRGLERVQVKRETLQDEDIARLAYPVYVDNVKRLNLFRTEDEIQKKWGTWVNAIRRSACVDFWCAWHEQSIVAFTVAVRTPWGVELVMQRSLSSALSLYPNNALVYVIVKDALENGAPLVSFGLSAFAEEKDGLDRFKRHMGFESISLNEHYTWHPLLNPFAFWVKPTGLRSLYNFVLRTSNQ